MRKHNSLAARSTTGQNTQTEPQSVALIDDKGLLFGTVSAIDALVVLLVLAVVTVRGRRSFSDLTVGLPRPKTVPHQTNRTRYRPPDTPRSTSARTRTPKREYPRQSEDGRFNFRSQAFQVFTTGVTS
jgi:hypothetical protein